MNISACDRALYLAAGNMATPLADLLFLVGHSDSRIRARVADNSSTPKDWLSQLASDESPDVRIAVAENKSTPLALRETLAQDGHVDVRYAIAENANTLPHLLRILFRDDNPYVAARAMKTLHNVEKAAVGAPIQSKGAQEVNVSPLPPHILQKRLQVSSE